MIEPGTANPDTPLTMAAAKNNSPGPTIQKGQSKNLDTQSSKAGINWTARNQPPTKMSKTPKVKLPLRFIFFLLLSLYQNNFSILLYGIYSQKLFKT
jgi:hypothetical protein